MNNNSEIAVAGNTKKTSYIVFGAGDKKYAADIDFVMEVIPLPELEMPLTAPFGIAGVFNYKGLIIKTVDICPFLGIPTKNFSVSDRLIIAASSENCFAIHTSEIYNIISPSPEEVQPVPFEKDNSIVDKMFVCGNETVNIINTETLQKNISMCKDRESEIDYKKLMPQEDNSRLLLKQRSSENRTKEKLLALSVDDNSENRYIVLVINSHRYCLDIRYVKEFVSGKKLRLAKLPYTEKFIKGIVNIKGEFTLLFDVEAFLGNGETELTDNTGVIVAEGRDFNLAIPADKIEYIKNLSENDKSLYAVHASPYISKEFEETGELYDILDAEKILNDEKLYVNIK